MGDGSPFKRMHDQSEKRRGQQGVRVHTDPVPRVRRCLQRTCANSARGNARVKISSTVCLDIFDFNGSSLDTVARRRTWQ